MMLDVNAGELARLSNRLEKLNRSAFPVAVRGTLNKAAFDVKKNTLPRSTDEKFVNRTKTFFKAFSKVEKADGFDVNSMRATVGMSEKDLKGNNNYAIKDLEKQEEGGKITNRAFIPTKKARGGNNNNRVRKANWVAEIKAKKFTNISDVQGKNPSQRFRKAVFDAGVGGIVMGAVRAKKMIWRVESINGRKFRLTPIYSVKNNRSVSVKPTHFMRDAALMTAKKLPDFYNKEAERQFKKYWA